MKPIATYIKIIPYQKMFGTLSMLASPILSGYFSMSARRHLSKKVTTSRHSLTAMKNTLKKHTAVFLFYQRQKTDRKEKVHSVILKNNIVVAHSDITPRPPVSETGVSLPANDAAAEAEKDTGASNQEASGAQPAEGASPE
ncbi:hypothetical protein QWY82_13995 [Simiduia curdlanivorans]|uniref:hypothetical protein n=1 Tax=Simiduia curdlanivorans TaxID=1492769 RepID=UPI0025B5F216|nr:hypothetical protein [Simiduia curdlanivorans]MDN3639911.1 hypothetical protein [Simiduia curdlanivorans]